MHLQISLLFIALLTAVVPLAGQSCLSGSSATFNTPGTYNCSFKVSSATTLTVIAWGGGGAGGSGIGAQGGGGGGGATVRTYSLLPDISYAIVYTVGSGGQPATDNGHGGDSSFEINISGAPVTSAGGGRGANGSTGGAGGTGSQVGGRGADANLLSSIAGGGGGAASRTNAGHPASGVNAGPGGAGGNLLGVSDVGGSGGPGSVTTAGGSPGVAPGGGGGGRGPLSLSPSGRGGNGQVSMSLQEAEFQALPITLVSFTATESRGSVTLEWQTAAEENNDYMAIERSVDGRSFREIGRVIGAGTTQEDHYYTFTDARPDFGTNYYRLRQADFDGTTSYSPIASINARLADDAAGLMLYPNPADYELTVPGISGRAVVYNSLGQALLQTVLRPGYPTLDVSRLPPGQYWLEVRGARGEVKTGRFTK